MNNKYNPSIRLLEQNWNGHLQSFLSYNRPFMSDDAVEKLHRELSIHGRSALDMGSKVLFHFEVVTS